MPEGYVLAFDFGLKYIGVAVGQTVTGHAGSVITLRARNGKLEPQAVTQLVEDWRPLKLVVGLPLNMDGSESEMSERARGFAGWLNAQTGIEVDLTDERLTTRAARELGVTDTHTAAACLIAETWLAENRD